MINSPTKTWQSDMGFPSAVRDKIIDPLKIYFGRCTSSPGDVGV